MKNNLLNLLTIAIVSTLSLTACLSKPESTSAPVISTVTSESAVMSEPTHETLPTEAPSPTAVVPESSGGNASISPTATTVVAATETAVVENPNIATCPGEIIKVTNAGVITEGDGEGGGGEGGEGEGGGGPKAPTLTNPGNLPPAPEVDNNSQSQMGEERMIKVEDPAGQFTILFVDEWSLETDPTSGALKSVSGDWSAEALAIPAAGALPLQAAQSVDYSQGNGIAGFECLAIVEGDLHGLPAAGIIYFFETGVNPVTGKGLRYVVSELFIGGASDQLGHLTFSAPFAFYDEVTEIFDKIVASFNWQ